MLRAPGGITGAATLSAGTLIDSAPFTITQTWNDGAETFIGMSIDITDTASAAASLVQRWRVGGTVVGSLSKAGKWIGTSTGFNQPAFAFSVNDQYGLSYTGSTILLGYGDGTSITIHPTNGAFVVNGNLSRGAPVTKTADFTLAATENNIINNRAATNTVTLPAASAYPGREVLMKTIQAQTVVSNASNVVPRAGGAAGTAILAATDGAWALLVSDGTNWEIMMGTP